nr:flagellar assembly protein FliH [Dechloromonas sp.]
MIIPKEKLVSVQKWQVGSFDKKSAAPAAAHNAPAVEIPATEHEPQPEPAPPVNIPRLPTAEEIERIYEEARASGYAAGLAEGQAAAMQQAGEVQEARAQQFAALIANLEQALDNVDQSVAEQLLGLALEVAAQVTRGAIAVKNDLLLPVIREAVATLPLHHSHIILRMHPSDAVHVRELLGEEFSQMGTQILEDAGISPGGCLLQAGSSEVDATMETRWRRVLETIGTEPREWLNP